MSNVSPISLHKRKMKKLNQEVDEAFDAADEEFDHVTEEMIDFKVNTGEITLADAVKTIWAQAKRMDMYEQEIIRLKLLILEAARE